MVKEQVAYFRLDELKNKIFYYGGKVIGNELQMKKFLTNKQGMSFSKAKRFIEKIKVFEAMK